MNLEKIKEIVDGFLVTEFEADENSISNDVNMKDTLGLDSLDYIDMVVIIESHFGVKLGEADFKQTKTFNDFYVMIQEKIQEKITA